VPCGHPGRHGDADLRFCLVAAVTLAQDTVLGCGSTLRQQPVAGRTDVDILLGVVVEGAAGEAALDMRRALLLGQRHINGDAARLAVRNLRLGEIAAFGEDLRPLGGIVREGLAGVLGHHRELAVGF
jgi:hypothetical protein